MARLEVQAIVWVGSLVALCAFLAQHQGSRAITQDRFNATILPYSHTSSLQTSGGILLANSERRDLTPSGHSKLGDSVSLETARDSLDRREDLLTASGEHKKYILVKKKPKHKKIKMEVYKPKMKYKKIKMKVPVKKMKKKKVKGYLVKKEKHHEY